MTNMNNLDVEKLLQDQRVVDEINRHLWIESEKNGRDIGFEEAKADWLKKFSKAWMAYHMPESVVTKERKTESVVKGSESQTQSLKQDSTIAQTKKRRAKSYI